MHIRVTAKVSFDYDTTEGLVTTIEQAIEDTEDVILSGLELGQFEITTEVTPPAHSSTYPV